MTTIPDLRILGARTDFSDLNGWAWLWYLPIAEVLSAAGESVPWPWLWPDAPSVDLAEYEAATAGDPRCERVVAVYRTEGADRLREIGTQLYAFIQEWRY